MTTREDLILFTNLMGPRPAGVSEARVHLPFVCPRDRSIGGKLHRPVRVFSSVIDGRVILSARYVCGLAFHDVIPTDRVDDVKPCWRCVLDDGEFETPSEDAPQQAKPVRHDVYAYFDANDECLYVGMSRNLKARHVAHRSSSAWMAEVANMCILSTHDTQDEAREAEIAAIREHSPKHNVRHNRGAAA